MKKISVRKAVLNYLKSTSGANTKTVVGNVSKPPNQIHTVIWKLVKEGVLKKDAQGVLTLNNIPIVIDKISGIDPKKISSLVSKRRATGLEINMGKKISALELENDGLRQKLHAANVKYFDAVAVIKYLEAKLISVIK